MGTTHLEVNSITKSVIIGIQYNKHDILCFQIIQNTLPYIIWFQHFSKFDFWYVFEISSYTLT